MATLNENKKKKSKKEYLIFVLIASIVEIIISPLLGYILYQVIDMLRKANFNSSFDFNYISSVSKMFLNKEIQILTLTVNIIYLFFVLYISFSYKPKISKTETRKITSTIETPVAAGNGQHGSSRFLTESEKKELFYEVIIKKDCDNYPEIKEKIGILVDVVDKKNEEILRFVSGDKHSLTVGMSGSGKNRSIIFKSAFLQIIKGNSFYMNDIKGENFYYTSAIAKKMGYKVYPIDLREPLKSVHYNFLQPIINAFKEGDKTKAIDSTWDLVSALVGEPKGEPIWNNGECSAIAASILSIVWEAPEDKYKNLTNAYFFIANMCKEDEKGNMPLSAFLKKLPTTHPARSVFAMAALAHSRTRSSFFSSALGTLKLFANPSIAEMTSKSDFELKDISKEKAVIYMMLPDEKKTYYALATLFITQLYMQQVDIAKENGGRLPLDFHYMIDEAGNTPMIPILEPGTTAGRSRGILFDIFLQSYFQLKKIYKDSYDTIKANCEVKIYLKADDETTLKEISAKLGNYTVEVPTANISISDGKRDNSNYSSSAALTKRALLEPDEVGRIEKPDAICMITGKFPAITNLPDISTSVINNILGLGDEKYNIELIMKKEKERPKRQINTDIEIWELWNDDEYLSYEQYLEKVVREADETSQENISENKKTSKVSFI